MELRMLWNASPLQMLPLLRWKTNNEKITRLTCWTDNAPLPFHHPELQTTLLVPISLSDCRAQQIPEEGSNKQAATLSVVKGSSAWRKRREKWKWILLWLALFYRAFKSQGSPRKKTTVSERLQSAEWFWLDRPHASFPWL